VRSRRMVDEAVVVALSDMVDTGALVRARWKMLKREASSSNIAIKG
jgi:hypothetical protein